MWGLKHEVLVKTYKGFVFVLFDDEQIRQIENAYRTNREFTLIIQLNDGREIEANQVLVNYEVQR